ncbi:MAG: trypsin-like peptidase domain-containing protein, partial [Anaerolineaceae bacterium]|nr:trypsin-like peptidase domain-containing protein [Anaerolineaceae bacterium]
MGQNWGQPQPPQPRARSNRGIWITCGVVLVVFLCIGGFLLLGGLGALAAYFGSNANDLSVELTTPPSVPSGQSFQVTARLKNEGDAALTVDEIRLPDTILNGARLTGTDPSNTGQTDYDDATGYAFSIPLEPGEERSVVFSFQALQPGSYSGTTNVMIGQDAREASLLVVVTAGEQVNLPTQPSVTATSSTTGTLPASRIPYNAVVQIIALVNLDGSVQAGWTGSGSLISPDGLILTNAHVVLSDPYYHVEDLVVALTVAQDAPPEARYYAQVLQADAALDLAVIKITTDLDGNPVDLAALNLPTVPLGDSDQLSLGDSLVIIGYPGIGGETITLTRGEVSGFTSDRGYGNRSFIKTSAAIAGGNSGGLAANENGQLVGVPTQVGYGGEGEIVDCRALAD